MADSPPRPRVWLTISSFRNDEPVAKLLEQAQHLVPQLFERVLVVDSLGTGKIPELIAERGWTFVDYESSPINLGSAGNLTRRLEAAAAAGADYAYALNHDAGLKPDCVKALIDTASRERDVAVVYPLRRLVNGRGKFDVTGRVRWPVPRIAVRTPPDAAVFDVFWGSSNGTLYSCAPIRQGLTPWPDLWMGYEDLGYGWLLTAKGYRQVTVKAAVFDDPYEFRELGLGIHRTDKAAWYAYYFARNLVLIAQRAQLSPAMQAAVGLRLAVEGVLSATLRTNRKQRLELLYRGLADGLRGKAGFRQPPA